MAWSPGTMVSRCTCHCGISSQGFRLKVHCPATPCRLQPPVLQCSSLQKRKSPLPGGGHRAGGQKRTERGGRGPDLKRRSQGLRTENSWEHQEGHQDTSIWDLVPFVREGKCFCL